jgi:hypothetical protein
MKTRLSRYSVFEAGYALLTTLVFAGISIVILATTLNWTSSSSRVTERNNSYNRAVNAAEADVESVIARMHHDWLNKSFDPNFLTPYRLTVATTYMPSGWPLDYRFTDTNGIADRTTVVSGSQSVSTNIDPQLPGLYGMTIPCQVASLARHVGTSVFDAAAGVQQNFQLVAIPIFQFEAFYSLDMEINPGPVMQITGKVHGNADMYLAPQAGLEFVDAVETVGQVHYNRMTNDPAFGSGKVMPVFDLAGKGIDNPLEGAGALILPIGTNNAPTEVVKILDHPPLGEDPLSPLGAERFYNKVDLIVTTDQYGQVSVKPGRWDPLDPPLNGDITNTTPPSFSFITTSNVFRDQRELKDVQVTEFDVGAFNKWLTNTGPNSGFALNNKKKLTYTNANLNSVYIEDLRSGSSSLLIGVRVSNGQFLPDDGLTVATARPLYVMGNYNAPTPGSANTANTKPASLVGDSISVLSGNWADANSWSANCMSRTAANDTVNAAFLAGIVQTTNVGGIKYYSGGLENFPRFLENWSGKTFTYNGSMVVMFPSRYATNWWVGPSSATYYQAPGRNWAFDKNFLSLMKLPPCTPQARELKRGQWQTIAAAQ